MLGAGMVAAPVVDYLVNNSKLDMSITIASADINEAAALAKKYSSRCLAAQVDVSNKESLDRAIAHQVCEGEHFLIFPFQK